MYTEIGGCGERQRGEFCIQIQELGDLECSTKLIQFDIILPYILKYLEEICELRGFHITTVIMYLALMDNLGSVTFAFVELEKVKIALTRVNWKFYLS